MMTSCTFVALVALLMVITFVLLTSSEQYDDFKACVPPEKAREILSTAFYHTGFSQQIQKQLTQLMTSNLSSYLAGTKISLSHKNITPFQFIEGELSFQPCIINAQVSCNIHAPLFLLPSSSTNSDVVTLKNVDFEVFFKLQMIPMMGESIIVITITNISVVPESLQNARYVEMLNNVLAELVNKYFQYPIQLIKLPTSLQNICQQICTFASENGFDCC